MTLKQLRYALAVAEEGSFTRAARRCHTVQSALSHQVAELEAELGGPLFLRTSRTVRLTPAGMAFLPLARETLAGAERLRAVVASARGEVCGPLSVAAISTLTVVDLVDILADFHGRHSGVEVKLTVGMSEEMLEAVRQGRLDVAFVGVWAGEVLSGVAHQPLIREELLALLPAAHPWPGATQTSLALLAAHPLVDYPAGSSARRQSDEAFAAAGVYRRVVFEVGHVEFMARLVQRGLALGMVPASVAAQVTAHYGLQTLPIVDAPARRVDMVWSLAPSPAAMAFVEAARASLPGVDGDHDWARTQGSGSLYALDC